MTDFAIDSAFYSIYVPIIELKVKVANLLDARKITKNWQLQENWTTADNLITDFFYTHMETIRKFSKPELELLLEVFDLRDGVYGSTESMLREQQITQAAEKVDPSLLDLTLQELLDRAEALRTAIVTESKGLERYWVKDNEPIPDLADHKEEIQAVRERNEGYQAELETLSTALMLVKHLEDSQEDWQSINNEAQWLEYLANKS